MEKNFTLNTKKIAYSLLTALIIGICSFTSTICAQVSCTNETVLFLENFGTGITPSSSPDILTTGLTYQASRPLSGEGTYRIINSTQQKPEWQLSEDHTAGDIDGKMLVVNGEAETFYSHQIDMTNGFVPGNYTVSLYIMNIDTLGVCGSGALLTDLTFRLEYLSSSNSWVPLTGSPYVADSVHQTSASSPTWIEQGSSFTLPVPGVKSIRIILADGIVGGCGNDFAMDDIKFSLCSEGGPTPVEFLNVDARQKGNGVNVAWSTSQEINSNHFDVEKSADGNTSWSAIASVAAAGNSSVVKNYNVNDLSPLNGTSFYRVKETDIDGNYKYSKTVSVALNVNKVGVSVMANPFRNSLVVDFSSATDQSVSARLIDITGKQVAMEKWSIGAGSSRKEFSNVSGLGQGMYILNVSSASGEVLYNNKVMKQ
jgi:hypothetical protein